MFNLEESSLVFLCMFLHGTDVRHRYKNKRASLPFSPSTVPSLHSEVDQMPPGAVQKQAYSTFVPAMARLSGIQPRPPSSRQEEDQKVRLAARIRGSRRGRGLGGCWIRRQETLRPSAMSNGTAGAGYCCCCCVVSFRGNAARFQQRFGTS